MSAGAFNTQSVRQMSKTFRMVSPTRHSQRAGREYSSTVISWFALLLSDSASSHPAVVEPQPKKVCIMEASPSCLVLWKLEDHLYISTTIPLIFYKT